MWNKAGRGEVLNHSPIGYVRTIAGDFAIDPDEQVRAVVRLVFEQFPRRGSVNGVLRWLVGREVKLPIRPHFGPDRGELQWRRANRVTLLTCCIIRPPWRAHFSEPVRSRYDRDATPRFGKEQQAGLTPARSPLRSPSSQRWWGGC